MSYCVKNQEVVKFIEDNKNENLQKLLLKKTPFPEVSMPEIVQQIKGRKIAEKKIPYFDKNEIIFPPSLNLEQSSSQATAEYKAQNLEGNSFLDLTCGFGIDAFFISKKFQEIFLVEKNKKLIEIVEHNWNILGRKAQFFNQDLQEFLKENKRIFDVVYLDPARRDANQKKVFLLEDLSPNLLEIQDELLKISHQIILKLSPLIDLKYLISTLKNIYKIEIIAFKNDVKEVLAFINTQKKAEKILCKCINLESLDPDFEFYFEDEYSENLTFSNPEKYIYIPNNAVLKSGAFRYLGKKFKLKKLHPNTHIYTSTEKIENFCGRVLEIEIIDNKKIKKNEFYNIISKNYPLKPEEIKRKYKIKDGGNKYLIFTQSIDKRLILRTL